MKTLIIIAASSVISACSSIPEVEFELSKDTYVVNRITSETSNHICLKSNIGDTIIITSRGGSILHANKAGKCINDKDIKVVVTYAMSAAPFLAMYSKNICTFESTKIGVHSPYFPNKVQSGPELRRGIFNLVAPVTQVEGYDPLDMMFLSGVMIFTPPTTMFSIPISKYNEILGTRNTHNCQDKINYK